MKLDFKIIGLSTGLGLLLWLTDAVLDRFFFYEGRFTDLLVLDVPSHELYIRLLILICFVIFGLVCAKIVNRLQRAERRLASALNFQEQLLNTIPHPVFHKDTDHIYTGCNQSFCDFLGLSRAEIIGKTVYDVAPKDLADIYRQKDAALFAHPGVQVYEFDMQHTSLGRRHVMLNKATFHKANGKTAGLVGTILDITDKKEAEENQQRLIIELQEALDKVKTLSGFLPICASCKKIRDDQGYWNQVEEYIQKHSQAEFSHGICPDCMRSLYPEVAAKILDS